MKTRFNKFILIAAVFIFTAVAIQMNARYYNPDTGRFISADSITPGGGADLQGLNRYSYCDNNPVRYVDPTGHASNDSDSTYTVKMGLNSPAREEEGIKQAVLKNTNLIQDSLRITYFNKLIKNLAIDNFNTFDPTFSKLTKKYLGKQNDLHYIGNLKDGVVTVVFYKNANSNIKDKINYSDNDTLTAKFNAESDSIQKFNQNIASQNNRYDDFLHARDSINKSRTPDTTMTDDIEYNLRKNLDELYNSPQYKNAKTYEEVPLDIRMKIGIYMDSLDNANRWGQRSYRSNDNKKNN